MTLNAEYHGSDVIMNCGSCLLMMLRSLICIFSLVDFIQFSFSMCYKSKDIIDLYLNFLYAQYSVAIQQFTAPNIKYTSRPTYKCVVTSYLKFLAITMLGKVSSCLFLRSFRCNSYKQTRHGK